MLSPKYIVVHSEVEKNERAKEGVARAINVRYTDCIPEFKYISPHIVPVELNKRDQDINVLSI